ncbi:hypothetical protein SAMN02787118_105285 [Streptomyces mirabilis]|uniref:Uncharacterized protein n=1 Tax=Streptomyces mirabilis TaxID=68239 RepID=A0A1I2HNP3_9ACTN|nr:hypothetical protein SAMN02787118_105285 [Streptomyces mirabilis]
MTRSATPAFRATHERDYQLLDEEVRDASRGAVELGLAQALASARQTVAMRLVDQVDGERKLPNSGPRKQRSTSRWRAGSWAVGCAPRSPHARTSTTPTTARPGCRAVVSFLRRRHDRHQGHRRPGRLDHPRRLAADRRRRRHPGQLRRRAEVHSRRPRRTAQVGLRRAAGGRGALRGHRRDLAERPAQGQSGRAAQHRQRPHWSSVSAGNGRPPEIMRPGSRARRSRWRHRRGWGSRSTRSARAGSRA